MARGHSSEKIVLKKGPWSAQEDEILIAHIQKHGHSNWRALPRQAGLSRCGKSCRLRWTNYLNPDIKRGNFSKEEEDTIINLHQAMGNRWSAIAARLPGRTDNEIKNVWHTYLKKKLNKTQPIIVPETPSHSDEDSSFTQTNYQSNASSSYRSPGLEFQSDSSSMSSDKNKDAKDEYLEYSTEYRPEIDESFWSSVEPHATSDLQVTSEGKPYMLQTQTSFEVESVHDFSSQTETDLEFWYNILVETGGMTDLPEF